MNTEEINKIIKKDIEVIQTKLKEVGIEDIGLLLMFRDSGKSTFHASLRFSSDTLSVEEKKKYMVIIIDVVHYFNFLNLYPNKNGKPFNKYCEENIDDNLLNYRILLEFENYPFVSFKFKNVLLELPSMSEDEIRISNLIAIRTFLDRIYNKIKMYKEKENK